jgi:hypothetical protein
MKIKNTCLICGRSRIGEWEGRVIDGSWVEDALIDKKYWGGWVCSYKCLERLMKKKNGLVELLTPK